MFIDGELCDGLSGATLRVVHGDGANVTETPAAGPADAGNAAAAAGRRAAGGGAATPVKERAEWLLRFAEIIEATGARLAWIDNVDQGTLISVMRHNYRIAVAQIRYFAVLALQLRVQTLLLSARDALDFTLHAPFAVVARRLQGQSCGSTSRLCVPRSIYAPFLEIRAAQAVGDPLLETPDVRPLGSTGQCDGVRRYIHIAAANPGLELITGSWLIDRPSFYIPPIMYGAEGDPSGPLFTEEIFGPVLAASPFDDYGEVITEANSLPLGLAASVWPQDLRTALQPPTTSRPAASGSARTRNTSRAQPSAGSRTLASAVNRGSKRSRASPRPRTSASDSGSPLREVLHGRNV